MLKLAAAQIDVSFGEPDRNTDRMLRVCSDAKKQGARLVVFPECSLCGYCCESHDEAIRLSVEPDNEHFRRLQSCCCEQDQFCVVGYLERADESRVYNSLAVIGPDGIVAKYRKTHLPGLGVDRFTACGRDAYRLVEINGVRIGLLICYDCSFPEAARSLALQGADLVILPTNWPTGAALVARLVPPVRALENHIYFAAVNRIGHERGFDFIGNSRICHPDGCDLATAEHDQFEILYAEIDPSVARQKLLVRVPGRHEVNLIADRRPDLYGRLVEENAENRAGEPSR